MAKGAATFVLVLALVSVFLLDSVYSSDIQMTMANAPETAKGVVGSAKDTTTDAINKGQDAMKDAAGSAKDTASDAINKGQKAMKDTENSFADMTKGFFGSVFGGKDEEEGPSPAPTPAV